MKPRLKKIKRRRKFSDEFKKQLVEEFERGELSVHELGRLHQIDSTVIYRWIYRYSSYNKRGYRVIEHQMSSSKKIKELEHKIKELEQKVGQKQIMIDYLETMMEVAKDELDIDIKKNFGTPQSSDSKKGKKS